MTRIFETFWWNCGCWICLQVDGMDILCVREATRLAAEHCRSGKVTINIWLYKKSNKEHVLVVSFLHPSFTRVPFSWSFKPTVTTDTVWVTLVSGKSVQRCLYSCFVLIIYFLGCLNSLHKLFALSIIVLFCVLASIPVIASCLCPCQ